MAVYGDKNDERMSWEHETSKYDEFSAYQRIIQIEERVCE